MSSCSICTKPIEAKISQNKYVKNSGAAYIIRRRDKDGTIIGDDYVCFPCYKKHQNKAEVKESQV